MFTFYDPPLALSRKWKIIGFLGVFLLATGGAIIATVALQAILFPAAAGAETLQPSSTMIDVPAGATFSLSPIVLQVLSGTVTPVLAGLITRVGTSNGVKAFVSFCLMALATVLDYVLLHPVFDVSTVFLLFVTTLVTHWAMWGQVWKPLPTKVPDAAPLHGALGFIGPKPQEPPLAA